MPDFDSQGKYILQACFPLTRQVHPLGQPSIHKARTSFMCASIHKAVASLMLALAPPLNSVTHSFPHFDTQDGPFEETFQRSIRRKIPKVHSKDTQMVPSKDLQLAQKGRN